ncbi:mannosyltransferase [Echinicola marina]|uniref:glycosyltransferase n=1 Tax=Echinicola marina TaxID=2859768 RepID=UPI0021D466A2|nr:glycosyltransferase [Echinicola marina]UCS91991.1 mannosyltransferase [Echinicola marina]
MIPEIIHYCWFGQGEMSALELNCIESWKKHLPDYQIRRWDESNFDIRLCDFTKEAYRLNKFAFVSDVCRLFALYHEGGIYLDTDMLLLKSLDDLRHHKFFLGEEKKGQINAAIIGAEKNNAIIGNLLGGYKQIKFDHQAPLDIPHYLTIRLSEEEKAKASSPEYFYPLPYTKRGEDYLPYLTEKSYTVHLWNHSWKNEWDYLHDKDFRMAVYSYWKRLMKKPASLIQDAFIKDFSKYLLADKLGPIYRWYKKR